jgi:hypothetical protein
MIPPADAPSVLFRIVKSRHVNPGERLVLYVELRTVADPALPVYSLTHDEWRVEHHRHLMWKTRTPTLQERAEMADALAQTGVQVRVLLSAPRAMDIEPDEPPVETSVEKRRTLKTGWIRRGPGT